jgi:hypothetical protein
VLRLVRDVARQVGLRTARKLVSAHCREAWEETRRPQERGGARCTSGPLLPASRSTGPRAAAHQSPPAPSARAARTTGGHGERETREQAPRTGRTAPSHGREERAWCTGTTTRSQSRMQ